MLFLQLELKVCCVTLWYPKPLELFYDNSRWTFEQSYSSSFEPENPNQYDLRITTWVIFMKQQDCTSREWEISCQRLVHHENWENCNIQVLEGNCHDFNAQAAVDKHCHIVQQNACLWRLLHSKRIKVFSEFNWRFERSNENWKLRELHLAYDGSLFQIPSNVTKSLQKAKSGRQVLFI